MTKLPDYLRSKLELITPPAEDGPNVIRVPKGKRRDKRVSLPANVAKRKPDKTALSDWEPIGEDDYTYGDQFSDAAQQFKRDLAAGLVLA